MVHFCAVVGCSNRAGNDLEIKKSFCRIPAIVTHQGEQTKELSERRRNAWLASIHRDDLNGLKMDQYRVCSDHFLSGSPSKLYDVNNPDWSPSLKMGRDLCDKRKVSCSRYERAKGRVNKKRKFAAAEALLNLQQGAPEYDVDDEEEINEGIDPIVESYDKGIQTDDTIDIKMIREENNRLRTHILTLEASLQKFQLGQESFKNDDIKTKYFTGLQNYSLLNELFNFIAPSFTERNCLSKFNQLLLCLMRLRLNLDVCFLSHIFNVSPSTISRVNTIAINVMYACLEPLIHWPDREELRKTMPINFRRKFGLSVAVIIDGFEIFIERPSNLKARAQTWSNYKHHNTVKYLIGIAPQGIISYISKGWGGRVSDKHLTENSDFLSYLLPGDTVLADRGFDIADSVGITMARLEIPAFTRGKKQLTAAAIEKTRNIANVRIHVERVIGAIMQKYKYLDGVIPVDNLITPEGDLPKLDKEVTVCCALVNMNDSVIPFD